MRRLLLLPIMAVLAYSTPVNAQPFTYQPSTDTSAPAAEPSGPLNLQAALALTAARSRGLAAAVKEVDAMQGGVIQAGVRPNPELGIDLQDTRRDTRTTAGTISIPIELGGKRAARVTAAERARGVAIADLSAVRADLRAQTVAAFFNVLIAQEQLKLAVASADVAARGFDVASRRVAAGKVSPLEETRASVERANADLEVQQAGFRLRTARQQLSSLWGNAQPNFTEVIGDLDALPSRPPALELAQRLDESPELVLGRAEIERRRAVVGLERARRYPDVRLTVGSQRNNELGLTQTLVGVSIPLPLFDRNQGNLYEALVRADQAEDIYAATYIRLVSDLETASNQLESSRTGAATLQAKIVPSAQEAYRAATLGFEAGKFGFIDVLDAQRTLFLARIRYIATLAESYQAAIALDRILGR
jgi:cobalt-zinc-cadmium efflux system outer membrane protein